ncbi:protoglobin domain-containing protein [Arthrobacter sp. AL12]|uniref:protoglobin domain-containing protein n=1 Tax=Arthrobacter sp. AL12 TaxID=3042241 RepID=UPI00249BDF13|nr:protoglobin domain-containing protein [Arthrobacter sp. AL12]MDI3213279.1 protoglobin domain-containing protein [Arthrobacter sp. AL12]
MSTIPGYTFGSESLAPSPVSRDYLARLEAAVLWTQDDADALRRAGEVLGPQADRILDVWYGFVGGHDFLIASFAGADGTANPDYLTAVRARFAQWIVDTCSRERDQQWLDYQHEIALRHTAAKKNLTDGVSSTASEIHLRYIIAFIVPLTVTIRPFLAGQGADDEVEAMYQAWFKSVTLTAALWAEPYSPSW